MSDCRCCGEPTAPLGRGFVHMESGAYRCTGPYDGDGFADPDPKITESLLDESFYDGYRAAENDLEVSRQDAVADFKAAMRALFLSGDVDEVRRACGA